MPKRKLLSSLTHDELAMLDGQLKIYESQLGESYILSVGIRRGEIILGKDVYFFQILFLGDGKYSLNVFESETFDGMMKIMKNLVDTILKGEA